MMFLVVTVLLAVSWALSDSIKTRLVIIYVWYNSRGVLTQGEKMDKMIPQVPF